jgi:hypothetical protein
MDINYNFLYTVPLDYKILLKKLISCSCLYLKKTDKKNKLKKEKPIILSEYIDNDPLNIALKDLIHQYNNLVHKYVYLYNFIMTNLEKVDKSEFDICRLKLPQDLQPPFCKIKNIKINTTNKLIKEETYDEKNIYNMNITQKIGLSTVLLERIVIYKKKIEEFNTIIKQLESISLEDFKKELNS